MKTVFLLLCNIFSIACLGQTGSLSGIVSSSNGTVEKPSIQFGKHKLIADSVGKFLLQNIPAGSYPLIISGIGFLPYEKKITVVADSVVQLKITLISKEKDLDDVVVTGTLKEVKRLESPVSVEVYTPVFFKKNPTPNIYDALQNVNGVRPQLNCQVCNTGDIHINGLEGPYTMVLLDGMPIVSSLSTVYGLSGIPNALVERIEIVKGPASSLYGSEAVGGLINIITKSANTAPKISADVFSTGWGEINTDIGYKLRLNEHTHLLSGINYFNYQNKIDKNKDGFTDITLQDRLSIFQKLNITRKTNKVFNIAARYMYEDRWGGDMRWNKSFRGGDSIYAESIYTNRWEILSQYQLPTIEKLMLSFSYNQHFQNSAYGITQFNAVQKISFTQLTWDKKMGKHDWLLGTALRYTYYDDNTAATADADSSSKKSKPQKTWLPGIFIQDEINFSGKHKLLLGVRYDRNNHHGNIFTPRIAHKWTINQHNILRLNAGTGFRVVNLFTEDHAALTGAREVVIKNELKPERSYNVNINYVNKMHLSGVGAINLDASLFYTYFNNRIVGDFDSNPNQIIYNNLQGYAISKGITLNTDISFKNGIKFICGATLMENTLTQNGKTAQQILTEKFTGTWSVSYKIKKLNSSIDYTGNIYSPMRLPLLSSHDPRKANSPWWSIQNIQLSFSGIKNIEIYTGVKNLLNFLPGRNNPFLIARTNDPFDKEVQFDANGQVIADAANPYALTFDPNYVYAPNQGIRVFAGIRFLMK
ncbi:MAG TPA: TonB-dependent receptor [Ferruginibacter sp.]|nr:TonB-dependent receptor [Ferruginibacter sp.]HRE65122.1 TonB-dependent receptor [Ferruginibacter sp.]